MTRPTGFRLSATLVVGERLDDHRGAVVADRFARVPRHADRIPHVVQAVEERDQVEVLAFVADRIGDLESRVAPHLPPLPFSVATLIDSS